MPIPTQFSSEPPNDVVPTDLRRTYATAPRADRGQRPGHKPNLPQGFTLADIAADYAGLTVEEFGGQVDLVVGIPRRHDRVLPGWATPWPPAHTFRPGRTVHGVDLFVRWHREHERGRLVHQPLDVGGVERSALVAHYRSAAASLQRVDDPGLEQKPYRREGHSTALDT
jgi:hypothetical protein